MFRSSGLLTASIVWSYTKIVRNDKERESKNKMQVTKGLEARQIIKKEVSNG